MGGGEETIDQSAGRCQFQPEVIKSGPMRPALDGPGLDRMDGQF